MRLCTNPQSVGVAPGSGGRHFIFQVRLNMARLACTGKDHRQLHFSRKLISSGRLSYRAMNSYQRISRLFLTAPLSSFFLALLCFASISALAPGAASQSATSKKSKTKSVSKIVPPDAPVPFHAGETLQYQVSWATFTTAASVQLTVPERRDLFGWGTWHFRASAHTISPVRSLFPIDDQFDSYTDTTTLESRQYEMYLNEMGKKQDRLFHFLPQGELPHGDAPRLIVLPGTRDPLGALYSLRGVDWQKTPEFRAPVYDGRAIYEIRARQDNPNDSVSVAAGKFSASRVSIHIFQNDKEVTGMTFSAWFAHDAPRTPVLIQADLPFGNLRVELTSASQ